MRISGGIARGVPLAVPKGDAVRPATDGMRQAVFSSLGARVVGAFFWDLFAGSGAYGLEALSRGANGGIFVERNARALACLKRNLSAVGKSAGRAWETARLVETDVLAWVSSEREGAADLVFVDPPYEMISDVAPVLFSRLARILAKLDSLKRRASRCASPTRAEIENRLSEIMAAVERMDRTSRDEIKQLVDEADDLVRRAGEKTPNRTEIK